MKKIFVLLIAVFIAITQVVSANAHNSMVYPSKTTAAEGEEIELGEWFIYRSSINFTLSKP
jgi:uncharacterized GH25 family protein